MAEWTCMRAYIDKCKQWSDEIASSFKVAALAAKALEKSSDTVQLNEFASRTLDACVHVVSEEFGSGFHLGDGVIVTCAHVVSHNDDSDDIVPDRIGRCKMFIFRDGKWVIARCFACDERGDVALLRIVHRSSDSQLASCTVAPQSDENAHKGKTVIAVGNPGTIYDATHTPPLFLSSHGKILANNASVLADINEDGLGPIKHNAYTYWGHSGSPLFDAGGLVVAMHNSWDETESVHIAFGRGTFRTGMRRGVSSQRIMQFIQAK
jgi:S1-C subfamily serine protease